MVNKREKGPSPTFSIQSGWTRYEAAETIVPSGGNDETREVDWDLLQREQCAGVRAQFS